MATLFSFFFVACIKYSSNLCCGGGFLVYSVHWQIENLMRGFLHIISWDQLSMLEILFDHVREIFELIL